MESMSETARVTRNMRLDSTETYGKTQSKCCCHKKKQTKQKKKMEKKMMPNQQ